MAGVNQKISKDDYNDIQTVIETVLGSGSGQHGYGQPVLSSQVTESDIVTINEYAALRYDIINAYKHLEDDLPPDVDAQTIGKSIRYNVADEPVAYWQNVANSINTNRRRLAVAGQRSTSNHGSETFTGTWGSNSVPQLYCNVLVEFTTSENARFFFNSGGSIQFTSSRTGGSSTQQNASWTSLLSTAGTRIFGGNTPGTGVNPNDGTNYFRLSNAAGVWSEVTASSPYALNEWRIFAATDDGVGDNSSGSSRILTFDVYWVDNHVALGGATETGTPTRPGGFGPDNVDGTITLTVQTVKAAGVLEPTGSGNFTIETPSVTISAIQN